MEYQGSLSPTFVPESHVVKDSVSPAFVFNPYQRISEPLKQSIGHLCFLIEGVPPQPNYPPAHVPCRLDVQNLESSVTLLHPRSPQGPVRRSCLLYATDTVHQEQAIVKLHGVFVSLWKSSAYSPSSEFTRSLAGTVGQSLCHSCKPPIKRRGITLP